MAERTDDAAGRGALRSLRNPNFRLYLAGQGLSQAGSWFQQTAEIWLILLLTGSATAVGIAAALRFGPLLMFGIPAGLIVDRTDRRRLFAGTQAAYAIATGAMAIAVLLLESPSVLFVFAMILVQGLVAAVDNPLRRSMVRDLVTDDELASAVSLNSTVQTMARSVGPAIAGVLIGLVGVQACFAINALSYLLVLGSLPFLDRSKFRPAVPVPAQPGQIRAGFRYAWANVRIRRALILVTVLSLSALNWNVILPVYATDVLDGDATIFGLTIGILGIGAFVGGVLVARMTSITGRHFRDACWLLAIAYLILAAAPGIVVAIVGIVLLGGAATSFQIFAQTRLQLEADDAFSGRVLALYSVALVGMKPIGGLIVGMVMDASGPRIAAVACAAIAIALGFVAVRPRRPAPSDAVAAQAPARVGDGAPEAARAAQK